MQRLCYHLHSFTRDNLAASLLTILFGSATTKNLAARQISELTCPIENKGLRYFLPPMFFPQQFKQSRTCIIKAHIPASNDITILLPTSNQLSMALIVDLARTVVDSVLDLTRNITSVALPVLLSLM